MLFESLLVLKVIQYWDANLVSEAMKIPRTHMVSAPLKEAGVVDENDS